MPKTKIRFNTSNIPWVFVGWIFLGVIITIALALVTAIEPDEMFWSRYVEGKTFWNILSFSFYVGFSFATIIFFVLLLWLVMVSRRDS